MSFTKPLGFWGWLKWNYQGRYDLDYDGPFHDVYMFGQRFQMPGETRHCVNFSRRLEGELDIFRRVVHREREMEDEVWTRRGLTL